MPPGQVHQREGGDGEEEEQVPDADQPEEGGGGEEGDDGGQLLHLPALLLLVEEGCELLEAAEHLGQARPRDHIAVSLITSCAPPTALHWEGQQNKGRIAGRGTLGVRRVTRPIRTRAAAWDLRWQIAGVRVDGVL